MVDGFETRSMSPARKPTEGRVSTCAAEVTVKASGAPPVEFPALITMTVSGLVPPPSSTPTGKTFRLAGRAAKGAGQAEPLGNSAEPPCQASSRQPQTFMPLARPLPARRSSRISRQPVIVPTCWASAWPVVARRPISLAEKAWTIASEASRPIAMPTSSSIIDRPRWGCIPTSVEQGADGDMLAGLGHGADRAGAVADTMAGWHPGDDDPDRQGIARDGGELDRGVAGWQPHLIGLDPLLQPEVEEGAAGGEIRDHGGPRRNLHAGQQLVGGRCRLGAVTGVRGDLGARRLRTDHPEHRDREHHDRDQ